jgi:hypothetical protein
MGAVAVGALLFAVLLVVVAALLWQEARAGSAREPVYVLDDAVEHVIPRLSPAASTRLDRADVTRILEWGIEEHVAKAEVGDAAPVIGSGDTIEALMERSRREFGEPYDPIDIAEVIAAESDYLAVIGAVGPRVGETAP